MAQTGDIGSACTSVVTEYRQKQSHHTAPITVEAEYLSSTEIEDMIRELLWSYRQLYLPTVESDETSEQDYARYQRESDYAWSALNAAFNHQRGFSKELLRDMTDGSLDRITEKLIGWAREIEWPNGAKKGFWESTAETADECCEKTKIFMQDRLWPFTKIIRVYISAQILKTGIVLADLPGLQDTNLARVRATQDYLMKCDNIFIVAKIQRAITDQSVKSSLYNVLSRHIPMEWDDTGGKYLRVAVVCTRSEDINLKNAKSEFCGEGKRVSSQTLKQLEEEIEAAKASHDRVRKKDAKRRLEFLLIGARNAHVKEGLQSAYSSKAPNGHLDVFCVSNTVYEKYCTKGNRGYVDASGVPELRRFCHSISADAQLKEARHFLHSKLAGLLNSVGLLVDSRIQAQEQPAVMFTGSITQSLESLRGAASQSITQLRQDFMQNFHDQISRIFAGFESNWEKSAATEARSWETWHWTQYNAWCLRNGNHSTPKRNHVDWNAQIIWKMRMETEYAWELVIDEVHDAFQAVKEKVTAGLTTLKTRVLESPASRPLSALAASIDTMTSSWEYKLGIEESELSRDVSIIRRQSTESHVNSYILDDMIPSYRAASDQRGTGKAARQRQIVGGHICEGSIFAKFSIRVSRDMDARVQSTEDRLRQLTQEMLGRLEIDMNMALNSPSTSSQSNSDSELDSEKMQALSQKVDELKDKLATLDLQGKENW